MTCAEGTVLAVGVGAAVGMLVVYVWRKLREEYLRELLDPLTLKTAPEHAAARVLEDLQTENRVLREHNQRLQERLVGMEQDHDPRA